MSESSLSWATVSIENHVAEVVMSATGKAPRMGPAFWQEMPALFASLDANEDVRAIVLRGQGEAFSHGLDLAGMGADLGALMAPGGAAHERTRLHDLITRMQRAITCVASCRVPVIAAIHGWCIGGGVDLATACDVRVCSADAKFSVREVKLAMVADVGTLARLPQIIGQGHARELAFTGDDIGAQRAERIGLVNEVFDTQAQLFDAARALAARIARNSPLVVGGIKHVLNAHSEKQAADSLATVALYNAAFLPSKDLLEAIGAFLEKREPKFTGE